jgi:hypothetical protein
VTEILPVVAPFGTEETICVSLLTLKVALVPLKATPEAPVKDAPVMVTLVPAFPLVGVKLETVGAPAEHALVVPLVDDFTDGPSL